MLTVQKIIEKEILAIKAIPIGNHFEDAANLILLAKKNSGKVIVSGVGKAGKIGEKIAVTFCSIGIPSVFLHPLEAQHGDLGIIQRNDVLMLLSNSGRTREVLELEVLAKKLQGTIKTLAITGSLESDLAKRVDQLLLTGGFEEICPLGLTPTSSTTAMCVIGDILAVILLQKTNFTKEQYAMRHHSGYLGKKAKS